MATMRASPYMTLGQHMEMLGLHEQSFELPSQGGVPPGVVQRALQGLPISQPHAEALCRAISAAHGIDMKKSGGLQPSDIGLAIWKSHLQE